MFNRVYLGPIVIGHELFYCRSANYLILFVVYLLFSTLLNCFCFTKTAGTIWKFLGLGDCNHDPQNLFCHNTCPALIVPSKQQHNLIKFIHIL